ncbi:hypothetical protein WCLP8_5250003 [uncultured Gammaproteobacteria bacterium]
MSYSDPLAFHQSRPTMVLPRPPVADIAHAVRCREPTSSQITWLRRGLGQPGGKLPLFDLVGRRIGGSVVKCCVKAGWAEPWFNNPLKPEWEVCRLTDVGRAVAADDSDPGLVGSESELGSEP